MIINVNKVIFGHAKRIPLPFFQSFSVVYLSEMMRKLECDLGLDYCMFSLLFPFFFPG